MTLCQFKHGETSAHTSIDTSDLLTAFCVSRQLPRRYAHGPHTRPINICVLRESTQSARTKLMVHAVRQENIPYSSPLNNNVQFSDQDHSFDSAVNKPGIQREQRHKTNAREYIDIIEKVAVLLLAAS